MRYLLALFGLAASIAFYHSNLFYQIADFVYGSDSLYLPALASDIVHGSDLSQWNLPPSSYFFPDLIFFFATSVLFPKLHAAISAFEIAQYLLFAFGLLLLARNMLPRDYYPIIPGFIALTSFGFVFSIPKLEFYGQMIFVSTHHFGVMLTIPFVLVLTYRAISASRPNRLLFLLGTVSFLTTLSDWLYLVQVALPLAGCLGLICFLKKQPAKQTAIVSCALIVPALLGLGSSLLYILNRPMLVTYLLGPHSSKLSLSPLAEAISSMPPFHALLVIVFLSLCLTSLYRAVNPVALRTRSVVDSNALLPLYFLLTFILNVIVVVASGLWTAHDGLRYFLPLVIFSAFWGFPFIFPIINVRSELVNWAISSILALFSILACTYLDWGGLTWEYHPTYIQCLDEKTSALGIHRGLANYWQARPISMLSQNDLQVVQVNRDLSPYPWINNSADYAIEPEFVVIDTSFPEDNSFRLDANLITRRFGKPDAVYYCERTEMLVYSSNEKFRSQFRHSLKK